MGEEKDYALDDRLDETLSGGEKTDLQERQGMEEHGQEAREEDQGIRQNEEGAQIDGEELCEEGEVDPSGVPSDGERVPSCGEGIPRDGEGDREIGEEIPSDPAVVPDPVKKKEEKGIPPKVFFPVLIGTCALTLIGSFLLTLFGAGITLYLLSGKQSSSWGNTEKNVVTEEREVIVGASLSGVVDDVADSVVELSVTTSAGKSAGSGVILRQNGRVAFVATNFHVAGNATAITCKLTNGHTYSCTYMDGDTSLDIAMIRMDDVDEELTVATVGNSDTLAVGDRVLAIGNPLGELGGTVTDGIVSALKRRVVIEGYNMELLQTNAAVNPGNSGGGLFNMAGELVGIVNAKESDTGIEGLAFAIPINNVLAVLNEIMDEGYIHDKLTLGFSVEYTTITVQYSYFNYRQIQCFRVVSSDDDMIRIGDIIFELNGVELVNEEDLDTALKGVKEGDSVTVKFYRDNLTDEYSAICVCREYIPEYLR